MRYPITQINDYKLPINKYFVDELRNVYAEERYIPNQYRILKGFSDGRRGYLKVKLSAIDGTKLNLSIHRLVYTTISGIRYDSIGQINHIDGNKLNNAYTNLELTTPKENVRHSIINKLSDSRAHQLTLGDAIQIYGYLLTHVLYKTQSELARDIGYDSKVVKQLLTKTHPLSDEIDDYFNHN